MSVGAASTGDLRARQAVPSAWSLGFPVAVPGVWVWSTAAAVAALGDPPVEARPAARPELEDFVEACGKALHAGEPLALRSAARAAGELAPRLLRDLDAPRPVATRLEALHAALELRVVPVSWRDDLLLLLGLSPGGDDVLRAAVERLARGTLALLRERAPDVDPQPELPRYLADGTLERHLGLD